MDCIFIALIIELSIFNLLWYKHLGIGQSSLKNLQYIIYMAVKNLSRCLCFCIFFSWPLCYLSFHLRIFYTPSSTSDKYLKFSLKKVTIKYGINHDEYDFWLHCPCSIPFRLRDGLEYQKNNSSWTIEKLLKYVIIRKAWRYQRGVIRSHKFKKGRQRNDQKDKEWCITHYREEESSSNTHSTKLGDAHGCSSIVSSVK